MTNGKTLSMVAAVALTAAGVFALAGPAWGKSTRIFVTAPSPDTVTRHITYADLNLASAAGERTLYRRVSYGVGNLCDEVIGGYDRSPSSKFNLMACTGSAWNQARPQMDRAVQRARDIAATGTSPIAAAALTISIPH
jgi:UrcA family protein